MTNAITDMVNRFAAAVLGHLDDTNPHVALGPVVGEPAGRHTSFMVVSAGTDQPIRLAQLRLDHDDDRTTIELCRQGLLVALARRRPALVIHDFDDELRLVQFCAVVFPCERSRRLLANLEAERAA
jgi:hypothetical protein